MDRLRKLSLPALFTLAALFGVLALQSSHHHGPALDHQHQTDCSVCSWQQTSSHATSTAAPAIWFEISSSPLTHSPTRTHSPIFVRSYSGRAPPKNLL